VCNQCGEKVFHPSQLTVKSFVHQAVDVFTHFENKVLKSMWLTVRRPGLITADNLRGVRVPYAKPIQLFIIVNLVFYIVVQHFHRTDYTPGIEDGRSVQLRDYPYLRWAAPLDNAIAVGLDSLRVHKQGNQDTAVFENAYKLKVSFYSKTLIFILIPVLALLFYLLFYNRLKYYGAALIFATHFLTFNLILYVVYQILNWGPYKWFGSKTFYALPARAIEKTLYNDALKPFSNAVFGLFNGFEAYHVIFWTIWLCAAFRRMFRLHWIPNILASYLLARITFLLIFSLYKKFLIAFTLWNM